MMSTQPSTHHPEGGWEQQLIADYYDFRWHGTLEPLCEWLRRWKEGTLTHAEMDTVLEDIHKEMCEVRSLFSQTPDRLVLLIQALERDWFEGWVKDNAPPAHVQLMPSME